MFKPLIASFVMVAGAVHAAPPAVVPAKQELVQKVLQLWHIDAIGQAMLQQPVADAMQQARSLLQGRVPQERQDAAMRDIAADAKRFLDDATPLLHDSTQKLIPTTVAPLLAERFTEDELRQIVAILESPVKSKFEALVPEMHKALGEKLASDTRSAIDPKLNELRERISQRLRSAVTQ